MKYAKVAAVLFDWDLTLAYVLGNVSQSERLAALFKSQGLDYTAGDVQVAIDSYQNGVGQRTPTRVGQLQTRQDIINSYFRILAHLGYTERDWALGDRLYSAHGHLPTFLYDDALPLLKTLQQRGFVLGIISNHSRSARKVMEEHVGEFIPAEHITISQEVGVHKPAKTIFLRACRRIGIPPLHCVFVGNNLTVDARGAVNQGGFGRGLWLDREGTGASVTLPDRVSHITSLDQVHAYI